MFMRKDLSRAFAALAVVALALPAIGSTPASQDVAVPTTDGQVVTLTWTGTSPAGTAGAGSTCAGAAGITQDEHLVNLTVPAGAYNTVNVSAEFRIDWDDTSGNDLVLTLEKDGTNVGDSDNANGAGTSFESLTKANPAAGQFNAIVCSFTSIPGQAYTGKLILTATAKSSGGGADPNADTDGDGVVDRYDLCANTTPGDTVDDDGCKVQATAGLPPRFQVHPSQENVANDSGEPSLGYVKATKNTMFISYTIALKQTYPEYDLVRKDAAGAQLPQSCDALWEEKPGTLTTLNSLDPILFTDEATGRTFNSQLSGANSLFEYTDDVGDTWTPGQVGPPNGGADHQTIATGPYSAGLPVPTASWPATGAKRALYYCSQSVAAAFCSRSDDGGTTFGPGNVFKNIDCAAGALHGHVKVSPTDGTVYVPDSSQCVASTGLGGGSADHVGVFRSTDNGTTYSYKPVPQSVGGDGSDPSVGVATDGSLYMCYTNGDDASIHMVVSHDRGDTWINDRNIGSAKGVVQARFPQAIAGDANRGACAFLGTSTAGNGESLDFQGVWYGFIATTYDGGLTYHTVNVTPQDPVQGHGGIGPSGTNRNLLDFNDLQVDDEGRLLFGFADGCIKGCVRDPSANAFAAKGTIVRQTGGRSLFAKFDDTATGAGAVPNPRYNVTTPLKPTAACAVREKSTRNDLLASVAWNAPDTGGTKVSKYTVYRSSTSPTSGFAVIGTTTGQTTYQDTATNPSVEKYWYKVEAENAQGKAPIGNTIELPITGAVVDTCKVPGETIFVDTIGDGTLDDTDIVSMSVSEPKAYAGNFVVTEKIANFSTGTPAGVFYGVLFPPPANTYFALDTTGGAPSFDYGTYSELPQGLLAFTRVGGLDARSNYAADGTITFVVPREFFGNPAVGSIITGWDARARAGSSTATSRDTGGPSEYVVRGTDICADVGAVVLGLLNAVPTEGLAPLDVAFTLSGTPPSGKKLDSYTINFGEPGADPQSGFFDAAGSLVLHHTYQNPGVYRARLTVRDITGTASNEVEQTITVLSPKEAEISNNRLGGALPVGSLLILGLLAALRRRR